MKIDNPASMIPFNWSSDASQCQRYQQRQNTKLRAARENRLERRLRNFINSKVLVVDEIGYLPLDEVGVTLFFQLVTARYERGSTILSSNKSFGDWGSIFDDAVLVTALLERLLYHATVVNIKGESYRLKERRKAGLLSTLAGREKEPNNENNKA